MTRVRIAVFILAGLITLSTLSAFIVDRSCREVSSILHMADTASSMKDEERAALLCSQAYERWTDKQPLLVFCVSYDKLCEADKALCRLAPLLQEDCDEFPAELASAEKLLDCIADGERPHLS